MSIEKYNEYIDKYRKLYSGEEPGKRTFTDEQAARAKKNFKTFFNKIRVKPLMQHYAALGRPFSVLDYGSAIPWNAPRIMVQLPHAIQQWYFYDPAWAFNKKPTGMKFDVVTCTSVIEHVPEESLDYLFKDIQQYMWDESVVIFNTTNMLSGMAFSDGEETHITLKTKQEWIDILNKYFTRFCLTFVSEHELGAECTTYYSFKY